MRIESMTKTGDDMFSVNGVSMDAVQAEALLDQAGAASERFYEEFPELDDLRDSRLIAEEETIIAEAIALGDIPDSERNTATEGAIREKLTAFHILGELVEARVRCTAAGELDALPEIDEAIRRIVRCIDGAEAFDERFQTWRERSVRA